MKKIITLLVFAFTCLSLPAQNRFQQLYTPAGGGAECFGSYQLNDGGYIFTGILIAATNKVFMTRTDCDGQVLWSKTYNNSSTIGNISQRVIPLKNGGFCLAASIGQFGAYNILIVKTDHIGNTLWQKVMQGSGDDVVNSIIETTNGDLVLAGNTNSFGQDAGSAYCDVYIAKIDAAGNYLWGKTIGTAGNIDQAFDIVEAADSGYVATGRYIDQGTFYSFILKTDQLGTVQFLKAYGDTNQHTFGFGIIKCTAGGYAITGSTTIMKPNYQSYADEFIVRTDLAGDTLWARTYHGTNSDNSENASSILELSSGYVLAVATMSYPTVGFVPNKHVILKTDFQGNMTMVKSYNNGGSHYPYITKPADGVGILLSGFTTNYSVSTFKPIIIRTDNNFDSGCNQTDLLSQTVMEYPPFKVRTPVYVVANGGSLTNSNISANLAWADSAFCAFITDSCNISGTGISDPAFSGSENVYYNSLSGQLVFKGFGKDILSVELVDYSGRLILKQKHVDPISINKSNAKALYFVIVKSTKGFKSFKVLVID